MQPKKSLFIHIGTNKTGTSAIQHFLNKERKALAGHGLCYPSTGCAGDAHYQISRILGFDHGQQPAPEDERKAMLARFKSELETSRCEKCVISSENFVLPKKVELVREFFDDFACKIIVYFRRHDHWWFSAYSQAVKMVVQPPWQRGFQGFLKFNRKQNPQFGNYRALLDRWDKTFGRENIIVRPYEREQNQPDIIADFLSSIGFADLNSHFSEGDVCQINKSLDPRSIFLLETFQRMQIDADTRQSLIDYVIGRANPVIDQPALPPETRRALADENRQLYQYIAQTYMNRPDGILFFEPLADSQEAWTRPGEPTVVEVAEVVARALTTRMGR